MVKTIKTDFCVIGGGIAGVCAAIAAARSGISVALINDRDVPGGNASSENRIHLNGGATGNGSVYSRESGISDEIKLSVLHGNPVYNQKKDYHLSDMALLQMIMNEENLQYFCGTAAYDCDCENGIVKRVYATKPKTNENFIFESELFCDASGDGIIAYRAGAEYRVGREAASEFGESLAPEKADSCVMGSCILFTVEDCKKPVKFVKPPFAYDFVNDGIIKYFDRPETGRCLPNDDGPFNGIWWLEYGGLNDTISDSDAIDFEIKKILYSYWDYIKNSGKYPKSENLRISWIAPFASKRESRRFIGDTIMSQNDIQQKKEWTDAVATGGWSLDIHDVGGIYGNEKTSAFGDTPSMYNIPLSIMYSKNINNLFLAGRIVSCTHVAMGSLRVMQTLGAMAQAVGTAAALCKKHNALPREIKNNHIDELQNLLQKNSQYIIGLSENCGLAKNAKITASSMRTLENTSADYEYPLESDMIFALPINDCAASGFDVKLRNNGEETTAECNIYKQNKLKNYRLGDFVKTISVVVPSSFDGYLHFDIDYESKDEMFFAQIKSNKSLCGFYSFDKISGAPSFTNNCWRHRIGDETANFCFRGYDKHKDFYRPENVVNGISRPFMQANCWVSENNKNEWLKLEFPEKTDISQLVIILNAECETEHFNAPIKQLITDYDVEFECENGVITREIRDNYLCVNYHNEKLFGVKSIKITPLKNNGAKWFEIFAVKVF